MIIQGSNVPLTIQFDANVAEIPKLVVTLWNDSSIRKLIKKWEKSDMTISEDTAISLLNRIKLQQHGKRCMATVL